MGAVSRVPHRYTVVIIRPVYGHSYPVQHGILYLHNGYSDDWRRMVRNCCDNEPCKMGAVYHGMRVLLSDS